MIDFRKRLRRFDILDYSMIKTYSVIIGIIFATYISSLRGFVEQNIVAVIFILCAIIIRPILRFFKKRY